MFEVKREIIVTEEFNDKQIDGIFGRQVGFDMEQIPDKMKAKVEETRKYAMEHFAVTSLYQSVPLAPRTEEDDTVMVASGQIFHSRMMNELLQDAECIVGIASTLRGFEKAMEEFTKITDQVYLDGWATAIITSSNLDLRMKLKKQIEGENMYTTATWSPGQHGFHIKNQRPFFEVFDPGEIGIRLKDTLMMSPQKSETMLFGVSPVEQKDSLPPCAFCSSRDTCPNAFAEQGHGA